MITVRSGPFRGVTLLRRRPDAASGPTPGVLVGVGLVVLASWAGVYRLLTAHGPRHPPLPPGRERRRPPDAGAPSAGSDEGPRDLSVRRPPPSCPLALAFGRSSVPVLGRNVTAPERPDIARESARLTCPDGRLAGGCYAWNGPWTGTLRRPKGDEAPPRVNWGVEIRSDQISGKSADLQGDARPMAKIIYTHTDEAPMLATYSFLPIVEAFASTAGVEVETRDISLAGRIIAVFGDYLTAEQRISDALAELGELAKKPEANIIKLPNISASVPAAEGRHRGTPGPGLRAAGLPGQPLLGRGDGHPLPLRQDQGLRREPGAARRQLGPPRPAVGQELRPPEPAQHGCLERRSPRPTWPPWTPTTSAPTRSPWSSRPTPTSRSSWSSEDGTVKVLKQAFPVLAGEVIDGTVMRAAALDEFLAAQVARAKEEGVLFSAHLKATMMKVSDPIIFGHVVKAYFAELFDTYGEQLAAAGLSPNNGLASILNGLEDLPEEIRGDVQAAINKGLERGPGTRHGRLRQGHHQPARALRRHRRRLDAGHDPQLRPHVGPRRPGSRHARRPPGQQLRRHLPGRHRRLPRPRRLRSRPPWAPSRTSA